MKIKGLLIQFPNEIEKADLTKLVIKETEKERIKSLRKGIKLYVKDLQSGEINDDFVMDKFMVAVIDGVIHDTYDATRENKRCVYGYYILKNK